MILCVVFFLIAAAFTCAQIRVDAGVGLAFPTAIANFRELEGFPTCCPQFNNGSGMGITMGVGVDVPLVGNVFMSGRITFADHGHRLTTQENISILVNQAPALATIEHSINFSQQTTAAELLLGYRFHRINTKFGVGYLVRGFGSLTTEERLVSPPGATFVDTETTTRNIVSGVLPQPIKQLWQVQAAASVVFPLDVNNRWNISPEIGVAVPLQSLTSQVPWRLWVPTAAVRLSWSPFKESTIQPPGELTTGGRNTVPTASVDAARMDEEFLGDARNTNGIQLEILGSPNLVIEEVEKESFLPLLPYVFFDAESNTVPSRYLASLNQQLPTDAEASDVFHTKLLLVIAKRLLEFPKATITITGTTSAGERNVELAHKRAEAVANIFVNQLGIEKHRIRVRSTGLPELPSLAGDDEQDLADQENRRVEIASDDEQILMPYHVIDTSLIMTPPKITIAARALLGNDLRSWSLAVNQQEIRSSEKAFTKPVVFIPTEAHLKTFVQNGRADVSMVGDVEGVALNRDTSLPITTTRIFTRRQTVSRDSIIEVFELIVFPYNSAQLTYQHRLVLDLVLRRIGKSARVEIEGRTDIIGDVEANKQLSLRRAQAVADYLNVESVVRGNGEPETNVQQRLPEQRMLHRTVLIRAYVPRGDRH
jgi:outer membrane protein OmpA-like peptidoglycan-associated protein